MYRTADDQHDRFAYARNIANACRYRERWSAFWPPADSYRLLCLDLAGAAPPLGEGFFAGLAALREAIGAEWRRAKEAGGETQPRFREPRLVAECLRRLIGFLSHAADREALAIRADAVELGYDDARLATLARLQEDVAVVAGQIATWYGKQAGGLPTAFACAKDARRQALVGSAVAQMEQVGPYLARLHAALRIGEPPAFTAGRLFFMAGEGDLHPKHIAYFLPEDEGVKRSPFKKTYYFANTHGALLEGVGQPLFERFVDIGVRFDPRDERCFAIPTLGVLAHELGHFVHRAGGGFADLNRADRWISVLLQEAAADVFGTLILCEVWAPPLGLRPVDVLAYYLAECLRYTDRGLGHFPDSDGMALQLNYFVRLGALRLDTAGGPRLAGDPDTVLAALRSLARVLADALLAGDAERGIALHRAFGPLRFEAIRPLLDALAASEPKSVEYVQEHLCAPAALACAAE
jgi:hypothetical protein